MQWSKTIWGAIKLSKTIWGALFCLECSDSDDDEDEEFLGMSVVKLWDEKIGRVWMWCSIVAQAQDAHSGVRIPPSKDSDVRDDTGCQDR